MGQQGRHWPHQPCAAQDSYRDSAPIKARPRRTSPRDKQIICENVLGMRASGVVVPSNSEWISEPVLVVKKDGDIRFCVDYRPLNEVTVKDQYPVPIVAEVLDCLGGAMYFSKIDLKAGYWQLGQVVLEPSDRHKTAFRTCCAPRPFVEDCDGVSG